MSDFQSNILHQKSQCAFTYLPAYLPTYLPTCIPTYLPAYLPTNLPTYKLLHCNSRLTRQPWEDRIRAMHVAQLTKWSLSTVEV